MEKIYKYPLELVDFQTVELPVGAKVLYTEVQNEQICLWALINPESPKIDRNVRIFGTGHDVPDTITERQYYGTVLMQNGQFVWHIFIEG